MSISSYIARRYLFSRRLPTAVNVLAGISAVGIALGTAALVLVLSVFNGFEDLLRATFRLVDPDIRIEAARGKYLPRPDSLARVVQGLPVAKQFRVLLPTLEGRAALSYFDRQALVRLKGVPTLAYSRLARFDSLVVQGRPLAQALREAPLPWVLVGGGVAARTSASVRDTLNPARLQSLAEGANLLSAPDQALRSEPAYVCGVFLVQREYDESLVFADTALVRRLLALPPGAATALEIRLQPGASLDAAERALIAALGPAYRVRTWRSLHETMYAVLRTEKAIGYLVLVLMLAIAACTIVGALTMVVIEKHADIGVLRTMGARAATVRNIFLRQGALLGVGAAAAGLLLGGTLGWAQQTYGFVRIDGGPNFLTTAWPMALDGKDFLLVFATVAGLSLLAAWYPASRAARIPIAQAVRE